MLTVAEQQTYKQKDLTFILKPEKVIVKTHLQTFYLSPKSHYYNRRMMLIQRMIKLGEIRDLNELASFCAGGNISWVISSISYNDLVQ